MRAKTSLGLAPNNKALSRSGAGKELPRAAALCRRDPADFWVFNGWRWTTENYFLAAEPS